MLKPKLFTTLQNYSQSAFVSDLIAGVIVGIVAIPLAIAFGIASGVTPDKGLLTAVIAGFIVSVLGGSRVQIGGPTGAFIVIVYGIVQQYGVDGLILATMLAGVLLVLMGAAGFGASIKFVPHSVIVGFTSGIAVVIFSSQVRDFLGLDMGKLPADFLEKWTVYSHHLASFNAYAFLIALGTLVFLAFWPRVSHKIPGSIIALVVSAAAAKAFHWPVETIGSRFGDLPRALPLPQFPHIDFPMIQKLMKPAITIAMLGGIESLLSAVVSDGMIGGRHRSNMELVAQGVANIASALFGGMPATGAIARTVTNIKNGGRTPVAGIIHAMTILLAMFFFGPWVKLVPMACLAGILVIVSYHMSEWRSFFQLLKGSRGARMVLLATFFLTVILDLTIAIEAGMILSFFLFVKRMADATEIKILGSEDGNEEDKTREFKIPKDVELYEVNGALFFGASHKFEEAIRVVAKKPKIRILGLANVSVMDSTGLHSLENFHKKCKKDGIRLWIAGIHAQPLWTLQKSDLYERLGEDNFFGDIKEALRHAGGALPPKN